MKNKNKKEITVPINIPLKKRHSCLRNYTSASSHYDFRITNEILQVSKVSCVYLEWRSVQRLCTTIHKGDSNLLALFYYKFYNISWFGPKTVTKEIRVDGI